MLCTPKCLQARKLRKHRMPGCLATMPHHCTGTHNRLLSVVCTSPPQWRAVSVFMPTAPRKPCRANNCPALVERGTWCTEHYRPALRTPETRATSAQRGYGYRWQLRRAQYLSTHRWCVWCGELATDVDHIIRKRDGGADDESNWQSLCHSCHSIKTANEKKQN